VIRRWRYLDHTEDGVVGLALGNHLLGHFELADDLLGSMHGAFHNRVPGPDWPEEDSHSLGPISVVHVKSQWK